MPIPASTQEAGLALLSAPKSCNRSRKTFWIGGIVCVVAMIFGLFAAIHFAQRKSLPVVVRGLWGPYPVIGDNLSATLLRLDIPRSELKPGQNGLFEVNKISSNLKYGIVTFVVEETVVGFWHKPMPQFIEKEERPILCSETHSVNVQNEVKSAYRESPNITSSDGEFIDHNGNRIVFVPFKDGSLLAYAEKYGERIGVVSIPLPRAEKSRATPRPGAQHPAALEVIRPSASFQMPKDYKFLRSFTDGRQDVVFIARPGRTKPSLVVPDVQLSFYHDPALLELYVKNGALHAGEGSVATILKNLPEENFNGRSVRVQRMVVNEIPCDITYHHQGGTGSLSFSFKFHTLDPDSVELSQVDYAPLIDALRASLKFESHSDDDVKSNERMLIDQRGAAQQR